MPFFCPFGSYLAELKWKEKKFCLLFYQFSPEIIIQYPFVAHFCGRNSSLCFYFYKDISKKNYCAEVFKNFCGVISVTALLFASLLFLPPVLLIFAFWHSDFVILFHFYFSIQRLQEYYFLKKLGIFLIVISSHRRHSFNLILSYLLRLLNEM